MMANHGGTGGHAKTSSSTPVKWTLVEAEPETPEGRRSKQQGYGRTRGPGASSSGSASNWRSGRDVGRGRGGGQGFSGGYRGHRRGGGGGGGSTRNHHGQGRGRGYGGGGGTYLGGATYYDSPGNFGSEHPSFEEQKAYMTNMAVRQIEFYFTVENLCRDIFMRSYMDEKGYIPIAFVANFPGVARFGVDLQDIIAGILASHSLQVDSENETMRMREGWEVWLLPNQATGKRGVPRYIKVDTTTVSERLTAATDATECERAPQAVQNSKPSSDACPNSGHEAQAPAEADGTKALASHLDEDNDGGASKEEASPPEEREKAETQIFAEAVLERAEKRPITEDRAQVGEKTELTPTAPAWTPHAAANTDDVVQKTASASESCPAIVPPDEEADVGTCGVSEAVIEKTSETVTAPVGDGMTVLTSELDDEATKEPESVTPELSS